MLFSDYLNLTHLEPGVETSVDLAAACLNIEDALSTLHGPGTISAALDHVDTLVRQPAAELTRLNRGEFLDFAVDAIERLGYDVSPDTGCLPRSIGIAAALVTANIHCSWFLGAHVHFPLQSLHSWVEDDSGQGLAAYTPLHPADAFQVMHTRMFRTRQS